MIPTLRNMTYEMRGRKCGVTTLEARILRGDQIQLSKILIGYAGVVRNTFSRSWMRE